MADIDYPSTLPEFRVTKSRTQHQTYQTTQPFAGALYIEHVSDDMPVLWGLTITCNSQIQSRQVQAFLRLVSGGQPFNKEILTEEGFVEHEVRFIDMPLQPRQLSTSLWEYSGQIYANKLIQNDGLVDDGLVIGWLQDASIIDNALNNLWAESLYIEPLMWAFGSDGNLNKKVLGGVQWTRGSAKTGIRNGKVVTFGVDEPALVDGGWELSPESTNNTLWSEDFSNSAWLSNLSPTLTHNQDDVRGTTTSTKINTTAAGEGIYQLNAHASLTDTASIWLKGESGGEVIRLGMGNSYTTLTITDKWTRYSFKGDNTGLLHFTIYSDTSLAQGFYVSFAQSEEILTPYIATTTAPVTRLTDAVTIDGENHPEVETGVPLSISADINVMGVDAPYSDLLKTPGISYSILRAYPSKDKSYYRSSIAAGFGISDNRSSIVTVDSANLTSTYSNGLLNASLVRAPASGGQPTSIKIGDSRANFIIKDLRIYDFALSQEQAESGLY